MRETEEWGGGGRAWRTGRSLRSSAGSSAAAGRGDLDVAERAAAAALHGKASRFASDNGAMTVPSSCRLPTPEELPRYIKAGMIIQRRFKLHTVYIYSYNRTISCSKIDPINNKKNCRVHKIIIMYDNKNNIKELIIVYDNYIHIMITVIYTVILHRYSRLL